MGGDAPDKCPSSSSLYVWECACAFIWVSEQRKEAVTSDLGIHGETVEQGDVPRDHRKAVWDQVCGNAGTWERDQGGKEGACKIVHSNVRAAQERDCRRGRELVERLGLAHS